jgi:ribonucleoside-diphosphate reductase alpha chain
MRTRLTDEATPGGAVEAYRSAFPADPATDARLRAHRIIEPGETARHMVSRVVATLGAADRRFSGLMGSTTFADRLGWQLDTGRIVLSPSIMANAGRFEDRPLATCAAPPVELPGHLGRLRDTLDRHHRLGMSIGLVFDRVDDPLALLQYLNHLAVVAAGQAPDQPPVAHAALLSLSHPAAPRFVSSRVGAAAEGESWRFDMALLVRDEEVRAALAHDGPERAVLLTAAAAAGQGAEPGLVFVDRLQAANPTPGIGPYVATSPSGEVGLLAGETCTFGQVNLARFHRPGSATPLDFGALADSIYTLVRALDDAVEASSHHYLDTVPAEVTTVTRKLGVGVCGLADLLATAGVDYGSPGGRRLAQEALAYVTYVAKLASVDLAVTRGACPAVGGGRSRYASARFLRRFAPLDVRSVSGSDWAGLADRLAVSGMLRNASITTVGPTGSGALAVGATPGLDPRGPADPASQVTMAAAVGACLDEGAATTVRVPDRVSPADVYDTFVAAWDLGCSTVRISSTPVEPADPPVPAEPAEPAV